MPQSKEKVKKKKAEAKTAQRRLLVAKIAEMVANGTNAHQASIQLAKGTEFSPIALRHAYSRQANHPEKTHGNQRFTNRDESFLLGKILAHDAANRPLTRSNLIDIAKLSFKMKKNWNGSAWVDRFLKRHAKTIKCVSGKAIKAARISETAANATEEWVTWYQNWKAEMGVVEEWITNADETRVRLDQGKGRYRFIVSSKKNMPSYQEGARGKCASYIPFVAANGTRILDVFVLPKEGGVASITLSNLTFGRTRSVTTLFCFTETGYLSEKEWIPIIKAFGLEFRRVAPKTEPVLLCDNLGVHRTLPTLLTYREMGVHTVFFPANCSHFLQPCDDVIFALFKKTLIHRYYARIFTLEHDDKQVGQLLVEIALQIKDCITPDVVKASFRNTGIVPFQRDIIISRMKNMVETDETHLDRWTKLALQVHTKMLAQLYPEPKKKRGSIVPTEARLYDSWELLQEVQKLADQKLNEKLAKIQAREERSAQKALKEIAKQALTCKGVHPPPAKAPKWSEKARKGHLWRWCEHCDGFGMCPDCSESHSTIMTEHENECSRIAEGSEDDSDGADGDGREE